MNACSKCGKPTSNTECPDCRYRRGGNTKDDQDPHAWDVVERMIRHTRSHFRDGFTADQLQQVSPSER